MNTSARNGDDVRGLNWDSSERERGQTLQKRPFWTLKHDKGGMMVVRGASNEVEVPLVSEEREEGGLDGLQECASGSDGKGSH